MTVTPFRQEGYDLLHRGAIALAEVEANGIRIDVSLLAETKKWLQERIRVLRGEIERGEMWKCWRRRFGERANLFSHEQLATVLFEVLHYTPRGFTESGRAATDEEALQDVDHPEMASLVRLMKYSKALGTYLKGIEEEVVEDRIHPVFNLHLVRSYRSSSDSPNFQNMPVRDKEIARLIRQHIIPSPGGVLVENDFKGIEVSVSACYHKDANFISYITTPGKDMHRDTAAQIYMLRPKEVTKETRYGAKNKFVFPQFYGDFYAPCARALWEWVDKGKLTRADGVSLRQHLRENGLVELGKCDPEQAPVPGTFEAHLQAVESDFWDKRFMDYGRWRRDWYRQYLKRGYFDLLSGFRIEGVFRRNAVVNYPVQGSAFHCLLWSLCRVNSLLHKYRMRSKIVGQIHDSLVGDVRPSELRDYLEIVEQVTTVELRKHYRWLIVPMVVEYELAPKDASWFDKCEIGFARGRFSLPQLPGWSTAQPEELLARMEQVLRKETNGTL